MRTFPGMIRGEKLRLRLVDLAKVANEEHHGALMAHGSALEHARRCGEALEEAFQRLGRRRKWTRWLRRHFKASPRVSRDYRRIYREWDDSRLVSARQDGYSIKSIQGMLDVLRGRKTKAPADRYGNQRGDVPVIARIMRTRLSQLNDIEKRILLMCLPELWSNLYAELQSIVRVNYPGEYGDLIAAEELIQREVVRRAGKRLATY